MQEITKMPYQQVSIFGMFVVLRAGRGRLIDRNLDQRFFIARCRKWEIRFVSREKKKCSIVAPSRFSVVMVVCTTGLASPYFVSRIFFTLLLRTLIILLIVCSLPRLPVWHVFFFYQFCLTVLCVPRPVLQEMLGVPASRLAAEKRGSSGNSCSSTIVLVEVWPHLVRTDLIHF